MAINDTIDLKYKRKIKSAGLLKTKAVLLVLSNNFFGKSFILKKLETIIGRDQNCDITIKDSLISKKHCKIVNDDNQFKMEDLDSTNSTYLNGKLLKKSANITYGDRIIIGDTILRFFLEEKFETKDQ